MLKRILLAAALLASLPALARDKVETWIEVRSDHFIVAANANEKQARHVADQFEHMRLFFHALGPKLKIDPPSPIIILAVKDEKNFRALEPDAYLSKGQVSSARAFRRTAQVSLT